MKELQPLNENVLLDITEDKGQQKTASGIIIPDNAKEKPQKGKVIATGPGKASENTGEVIKMEVKKGDVVLYGKYSGTEVAVDGTDYLIMRESDILAII